MNLHEIAREIVEEMPEEERQKVIDEIIQRKDEKCEAVSEEEALDVLKNNVCEALRKYKVNNFYLDKAQFNLEDYPNEKKVLFVKTFYKIFWGNQLGTGKRGKYKKSAWEKAKMGDSLEQHEKIESFLEECRSFYLEQGKDNIINGNDIKEIHKKATKIILDNLYDVLNPWQKNCDVNSKNKAIYRALQQFYIYVFNIRDEYEKKKSETRKEFIEYEMIGDVENITILMSQIIKTCLELFPSDLDKIEQWLDTAIDKVKRNTDYQFLKRKSEDPIFDFCYRYYRLLFVEQRKKILAILDVLEREVREGYITDVPEVYRIDWRMPMDYDELKVKILEGREERDDRFKKNLEISKQILKWMVNYKELPDNPQNPFLIKAVYREMFLQPAIFMVKDVPKKCSTVYRKLCKGEYDKNLYYDEGLEYVQWKIKRGKYREQGILKLYPYENRIWQKLLDFQNTIMMPRRRDIDEPLVWIASYQLLAEELWISWN